MEMRRARTFLSARYWFLSTCFKFMIVVGFALILIKAFLLQGMEHSTWVERWRAQSETSSRIPTFRGSISDREGRLMAYSVPQPSVFADGEEIDDPEQTAAQLARILDEPAAAIQKKLVRTRRFIWLKRQITDQQASAIAHLAMKGLHLVNEYKRFYPQRQAAGQVVGFVGLDGEGLEGIEKAYNNLLRENPLTVEQLQDGVRKRIWIEPSLPSGAGEHLGVRLTLDSYLQYICETELEKAVSHYKAKGGEVVLMDPTTFEVLAMANWPSFDPNAPDKDNASIWRNRAITDIFEPGSTFKVFSIAAGLEERAITERDRVFCENGKCMLAGHVINDVHHYGWLTVPEVIKFSSNIGASKLSLKLGIHKYHHYIKGFGFGEPTGITLPGEAKGIVRPWRKWRPINLVTASFGQGISVTSLQLTAAVACLANGGKYGQPLIVREIVDSKGRTVERFEPKVLRQVVAPKTAQKVCDMMLGVTQQGGTATNAAIAGYLVGGKTGTAQLVDPATGHYSKSKYTAVFVGFVPADKPRIVMTAVIHEPQGAIYGGVVAAPVFRNIATQALPYMRVLPSGSEIEASPGVRFMQAAFKVQEKAVSAPVGTPSNLMPDLTGLSLKTALQQLAPLKAKMKCKGSGRVFEQSPPAGTPVEPQTVVEMALKEER